MNYKVKNFRESCNRRNISAVSKVKAKVLSSQKKFHASYKN